MDVSRYAVPQSDRTYYIPEFITLEEEAYLIRKICESPQPKWKHLQNRRLQIWGGELTAKNILIPEQLPSFVRQFPDVVRRIQSTGLFEHSPHGAPNHIIMNEYLPGQGIMPHEDGPSYYPVVATLSLGSHAVFHYYRYKADDPEPEVKSSASNATEGRIVDNTPVSSLLLEPRSLVITTSSLYTSHLHGIEGITEDYISAPDGAVANAKPVRIANADLLGDPAMREAVLQGRKLARGTRYSLTCRDIARVASRIPFRSI